jgi:hypothetical protein
VHKSSQAPYAQLVEDNGRRKGDGSQPEFELLDRYFEVFVEYAKATPENFGAAATVFPQHLVVETQRAEAQAHRREGGLNSGARKDASTPSLKGVQDAVRTRVLNKENDRRERFGRNPPSPRDALCRRAIPLPTRAPLGTEDRLCHSARMTHEFSDLVTSYRIPDARSVIIRGRHVHPSLDTAGRAMEMTEPTRGSSSNRAEIYSKPPQKRPLAVIFHSKTAKMGIWPRLLREILAHNIDCMQVSALRRLYFTQ